MAETEKKTVAKTTKTTKSKALETKEKENALLKEQLELMQKQMLEMQRTMEEMNVTKTEVKPSIGKSKHTVPFVNMTNGAFVLKGTQFWTLSSQFDKHYFSESEAQVILNNMPNCVRSGQVYIADADFITNNNLEDIYENLLSDKELQNLLNQDVNYVVETYKMVSDAQKQIILDMVIDRRLKNKPIDANILQALSNISGKDLFSLEPEE